MNSWVFLLFHVGIVIVVFTLSSLLAADGDSMLGMFQQLKIELINSTILHGTHVVCNLFAQTGFVTIVLMYLICSFSSYVVEKNLVYVDVPCDL